MKKRLFFISCLIAIFMMSMVAFAESDMVPFDGGGYGVVTLDFENLNFRVRATSTSYSVDHEVLSTRVWGLGSQGDDTYGDGKTSAVGRAAVKAFTGADSNHLFLGRNYSMHISA